MTTLFINSVEVSGEFRNTPPTANENVSSGGTDLVSANLCIHF